MKTTGSVLIFEDDPKFAALLGVQIERQLGATAKVSVFKPKLFGRGAGTFEDRLKAEIGGLKSGVNLWVSDRDLSATPQFMGFSESAVSRVANELALPVCLYARGNGNELLDRQRNWTEGRIILDASRGPDEMGRQIAILYRGFLELGEKLESTLLKLSQSSSLTLTPSRVLSEILGKPDIADKLALYGSGDQKVLADLLPFRGDHLGLRIPRILGYWLCDSVLRFPGITVNAVAAASYLNIAQQAFENDERIQKLFRRAIYKGPFADVKSPLWWRPDLDEILLKRGWTNGHELCNSLGIEVEECRCSVDARLQAGYYCMIRKLPVSRENSKGNISWFPSGADLARIATPEYEEIGPWLGLF